MFVCMLDSMTEFKIIPFFTTGATTEAFKQQAENMQQWQPYILSEWMLSLFHSTWQVD